MTSTTATPPASTPSRLHPASIPYRAGRTTVRLGWVLFLVGLSSTQFGFDRTAAAGIVLVGLLAALAYEYAYYRRFTYELTTDTFDIHSGVLSRRTREIPLRRVQNVDISRNLIGRTLGIAEVRLETAGGSETEAHLRFVDETEARRLQTAISRVKREREAATDDRTDAATAADRTDAATAADRTDAATAADRTDAATAADRTDAAGPAVGVGPSGEPTIEELFAVTPKELALLGLVSVDLRILSFVTVLIPVVAPSLANPTVDPLLGLVVSAPLLALVLIVVSAVAGGLRSVTNYYDFTLFRTGEELRYERGLLQRFSGTIPLDKVQSLAIEENLLARRIGYASLSVETAGYAPGEGGSKSAVPLARRDRAFALARQIEPFGDVAFERPPERARQRYAVRYAGAVLLLAGVAFAVTRLTELTFAWYVVLAGLPLALLGAHLKWKHVGYALIDDHFVARKGFWTRTTSVVPYYRIQTVVDSQTIFQRRRDLATVVVDTAGTRSLTGQNSTAPDLDAARAAELREELADRLQRSLADRRSRRRTRPVVTDSDAPGDRTDHAGNASSG